MQSKGIELEAIPCCRVERISPDADNCIHPETGKPGAKPMDLPQHCPLSGGNNTLNRFNPFENTGFSKFAHEDPIQGTDASNVLKRDSTIVNGAMETDHLALQVDVFGRHLAHG